MNTMTITATETETMNPICSSRRPGSLVAALGLLCAVLLAAAAPAHAAFGVSSFDGEVLERDGSAASQASSHPHRASAAIAFNVLPAAALGLVSPDEAVRLIKTEVPPGLVGNPTVVEQCKLDDIAAASGSTCPANSQVGYVDLVSSALTIQQPLFSIVPPPGAPAMFAFKFVGVIVPVEAEVRSNGDYGLTIGSRQALQALPVLSIKTTFWGVPADPVNDPLRIGGGASSMPVRPFLTNPTQCTAVGVGLETRLRVTSWEGSSDQASFFSHDVAPNEDRQLGPTGCDRVPFDPSVDVAPTSTAADSPTGLNVGLSFPQGGLEDPDELATAHLRRARVTLPEGMTINPAAADGLEACSDAQLGLGSREPADCPAASKVGTVEAVSPLLAKFEDQAVARDERGAPILEKVSGGVYIRSQNSVDPGSGEMFRLALVLANEERGIRIKLPGQVKADPVTGRLTTTFDNNPQLPVESIRLALKSGPRAPLAIPASCGVKTIDTELTSWAGHTVNLQDSFTVPCPANTGFAPGFDAGTANPVGGVFSPLMARIDRSEGEQFLSGVRVDMPKGLIAKLNGVELCPDAVAGDGSPGVCPPGSRIGSATVSAGSGSPFYLQGDVYLTGPYGGGPYGLSVQVPALAGPFDLGMVKVRQSIQVDPATAELSVVSDPLPQVVKGVTVRLRSVDVDIDRPAFTINPTSCAEKQVDATLTSVDGAVHRTARRFQVGDCQALAFKPRMAMSLTGKRQTRTGDHPGFKTVLTQGKGQANIGAVKVTMPRSIALDAQNSYDPKLVCDYDKALKADCPASSVIGKATTHTPVLNKPLTGNVHLVQGINFGPKGNRIRTTPALLVKLRGEVAIDLRGKTTTEKGTNRLVTTFPAVPDAPVSKFTLKVNGGSKGILTVTRTRRAKINLCSASQVANVETDGQNGKRADFSTTVKTPCAGKARKAKRSARRR